MFYNEAILEGKPGFDLVDDTIAGRRKGVHRMPFRNTGLFVRERGMKLNFQIFGPGAEHLPHTFDLLSIQAMKHWIGKHSSVGIQGLHGRIIPLLKRFKKGFDQLVVRVHGRILFL